MRIFDFRFGIDSTDKSRGGYHQEILGQAKTTTQADRYQIIWLLAIGKTTAEAMAVTGYSRGWIYEASLWLQPFTPESLGDRRCKNTDCDPLLNDVEQAMVVASLTAATPRWRAVEWS